MLKLELKGGDEGTIREKLNKQFDALAKEFTDELGRTFGSAYVNENMFKGGEAFQNLNKMSAKGHGANQAVFKRVSMIYRQAWNEHYMKLREVYESSSMSTSAHVERKALGVKGGWRVPHNRMAHYSPAGYAIWSGMMSERIGDAFEAGGTQHLETTNLLLSGGHNLRTGDPGWERHYFRKGGLNEHFREAGVHDGDPTVLKKTSVYNDAKREMEKIIQTYFTDPLVETFNQLEIRI